MIIRVWWVEWRGVGWMCIVIGFLRNLMGWIVGYWCICSNIFIDISFIRGIRCFGFRWIIYWVVYRMNFIDYGVIFMRCCRVFFNGLFNGSLFDYSIGVCFVWVECVDFILKVLSNFIYMFEFVISFWFERFKFYCIGFGFLEFFFS